ncbi:MAG: sigma factor-like helix-turn-helix DNA-binding protein [Tetrasphaera sp.]
MRGPLAAAALRAITPRQRAVIVLRFYEDKTEVETAATLGCSVSTVAMGLVAFAAWPTGETSMTAPPAATPSSVVSGYPRAIAKPPFTPGLADHLGPKAVALTSSDNRPWVVDPNGQVARVEPGPPMASTAALSPDGRWLTIGVALLT